MKTLIQVQAEFRKRAKEAEKERHKAQTVEYRAMLLGECNAYWTAVEILQTEINRLEKEGQKDASYTRKVGA